MVLVDDSPDLPMLRVRDLRRVGDQAAGELPPPTGAPAVCMRENGLQGFESWVVLLEDSDASFVVSEYRSVWQHGLIELGQLAQHGAMAHSLQAFLARRHSVSLCPMPAPSKEMCAP